LRATPPSFDLIALQSAQAISARYVTARPQVSLTESSWGTAWIRRLGIVSSQAAAIQFTELRLEAEKCVLSETKEALLTELWQGIWVEFHMPWKY